MKIFKGVVVFICISIFPQSIFALNEELVDEMSGYMEFSEYSAGIIIPEQINKEVFESAVFIDVRDKNQYLRRTIPGAVNIEWRQVLNNLDEIPDSKMTILFCNTGSLSAQAAFALRVSGKTNVLVLQTGINGWEENALYKP